MAIFNGYVSYYQRVIHTELGDSMVMKPGFRQEVAPSVGPRGLVRMEKH
jgi:hypothetical protein